MEETRLDRSNWTITASSEQLTGENTGLATAVLDGDINTIWHTIMPVDKLLIRIGTY